MTWVQIQGLKVVRWVYLRPFGLDTALAHLVLDRYIYEMLIITYEHTE